MSNEGSGDFSIGSNLWPGISKLIEECGEVQQVAGKLIASHGAVNHWDGTNLKERLESELGDLQAAIQFVVRHNALDVVAIEKRRIEKLMLFEKWHEEQHQKDEARCVARWHVNTWQKEDGSPGERVFGVRLRVNDTIRPTDVYRSSDGRWVPWGDRHGIIAITQTSAYFVRPATEGTPTS